jgi:hypothetical protein
VLRSPDARNGSRMRPVPFSGVLTASDSFLEGRLVVAASLLTSMALGGMLRMLDVSLSLAIVFRGVPLGSIGRKWKKKAPPRLVWHTVFMRVVAHVAFRHPWRDEETRDVCVSDDGRGR